MQMFTVSTMVNKKVVSMFFTLPDYLEPSTTQSRSANMESGFSNMFYDPVVISVLKRWQSTANDSISCLHQATYYIK